MVADDGYQFLQCVTPESVCKDSKTVHARLRARTETCNTRLKLINLLSNTFRHNVRSYGKDFYAVAKLMALTIGREDSLPTVNKN